METLLLGLLILLIVLLIAVLVILFWLLRRPEQEVQTAVLAEKLSQLEPVTRAVHDIRLGLTELQTYAKVRGELERRTAESIKRLESIIAGTQSKGVAGENILEAVLSKLPPDWQVRDFRVGNKTVEFGLRLPNNLVLPIDSKWPATNLLEQFAACEDPAEQERLKAQIERVVLNKAREVKKYVDPNITVNFGIAAVPDAVYDLCSGVQADAFRLNVALISYSMLLPYLLLVFQTMLKASQSIDLQRLNAYLQSAQENIEALQEELEGRLSRAITMLTNSRNDMSMYLSRINSGLTSLQTGATTLTEAELPQPTDPGER